MSDIVQCTRHGGEGPPAHNVTYEGAVGEEIRRHVCESCWQEWQNMEVMVINELRLNFMDPKSLDTLIQHMREFFGLAKPQGPSALDGTPAEVKPSTPGD